MDKEIKAKTRKILHDTEINTFVTEEDKKWLIENVFIFHPQWLTHKIGTGIEKIRVRPNPGRNTLGFELHRIDGQVLAISIVECENPSSSWAKYTQALRNEVEDQRMAAFDEQGGVTSKDEVHHVIAFKILIQRFEQKCVLDGLNLENVRKTVFEPGPFGERLADREIAEKWNNFHKEHAVLKVMPKTQHKKEHGKKWMV